MFSGLTGTSLRRGIIGVAIFLTLAPATAVAIFSWMLLQRASQNAILAYTGSFNDNLIHLVKSLLAQCLSFHEENAKSGKGALVFLNHAGPLKFDANRIEKWKAVNQFTGESLECNLPLMMVGGTAFTPVANFSEPAPIVDELQKITGSAASVFQRMNEQGDMLTVSTTMSTAGGTRAIGVYLSKTDPDGNPNIILGEVLAGRTYIGRASTVNGWYIASFQPLLDNDGKVIGMLSTGVPESEICAKLNRFLFQVDGSGKEQLFVLSAGGPANDLTVITDNPTSVGKNIQQQKDAIGKAYLEEIFRKAHAQRSTGVSEFHYQRVVTQGALPEAMIARFGYFAQWDWVIGVTQREDSLAAVASMRASAVVMFWVSLAILAGLSCLAVRILPKLSRRYHLEDSSSRPRTQDPSRECQPPNSDVRAGPLLLPAENLTRLAHEMHQATEKLKETLSIDH